MTKQIFTGLLLLTSLLCFCRQSYSAPGTCSYSTYSWNTTEKKAVNFQKIVKPYNQIDDYEIDSFTGCTLCEEDQVDVKIEGIPVFKICRNIYPDIVTLLKNSQTTDFPVYTITGYRVGKTKGLIDQFGNRTKFSNHSYGIAIDINPQSNGLYDNCHVFSPQCALIKGGIWRPSNPSSIKHDSDIVHAFKRIGFKWGGEIKGKQKDFMHFSPSGY